MGAHFKEHIFDTGFEIEVLGLHVLVQKFLIVNESIDFSYDSEVVLLGVHEHIRDKVDLDNLVHVLMLLSVGDILLGHSEHVIKQRHVAASIHILLDIILTRVLYPFELNGDRVGRNRLLGVSVQQVSDYLLTISVHLIPVLNCTIHVVVSNRLNNLIKIFNALLSLFDRYLIGEHFVSVGDHFLIIYPVVGIWTVLGLVKVELDVIFSGPGFFLGHSVHLAEVFYFSYRPLVILQVWIAENLPGSGDSKLLGSIERAQIDGHVLNLLADLLDLLFLNFLFQVDLRFLNHWLFSERRTHLHNGPRPCDRTGGDLGHSLSGQRSLGDAVLAPADTLVALTRSTS